MLLEIMRQKLNLQSGLNAIEVKYYLLPLMLANPSTSSVTCKDNIHYIVVGQFYTNPIISDRSVADPTVIKAQDGRFYWYATQNSNDWMPVIALQTW